MNDAFLKILFVFASKDFRSQSPRNSVAIGVLFRTIVVCRVVLFLNGRIFFLEKLSFNFNIVLIFKKKYGKLKNI